LYSNGPIFVWIIAITYSSQNTKPKIAMHLSLSVISISLVLAENYHSCFIILVSLHWPLSINPGPVCKTYKCNYSIIRYLLHVDQLWNENYLHPCNIRSIISGYFLPTSTCANTSSTNISELTLTWIVNAILFIIAPMQFVADWYPCANTYGVSQV